MQKTKSLKQNLKSNIKSKTKKHLTTANNFKSNNLNKTNPNYIPVNLTQKSSGTGTFSTLNPNTLLLPKLLTSNKFISLFTHINKSFITSIKYPIHLIKLSKVFKSPVIPYPLQLILKLLIKSSNFQTLKS